MSRSNGLSLIVGLLALLAGSVLAGAADSHEAARMEIYTFSELLAKAERIVVADVGPLSGASVTLTIRESLKAPEAAPNYISPERMKRAADLLANDKLNLPPLPPDSKPPASMRVRLQNVVAPREGTQAVFFLWERVDAVGGVPTYLLGHPQCIYDAELASQVKVGLAQPRAVADGRYLRDWDRQAAERQRQGRANDALINAPRGEVVMGLRLVARRPTLSLRGNNGFAITVRVENTRNRAQAIYDGPAGGYGVVLRPKAAQSGGTLVLRQSTSGMGTDSAVLNIADATDFATISADGFLTKELYFDARNAPVLTTLQGDYVLCAFFVSAQTGKGLDIDNPVWTGTLVSDDIPIRFESPVLK